MLQARHHLATVGTDNTNRGLQERSLLNIIPLCCLHPLPVSSTSKPIPWQIKTTAVYVGIICVQASVREACSGNCVWFLFLNYTSAPRGMSCDGSQPTQRPQGKL